MKFQPCRQLYLHGEGVGPATSSCSHLSLVSVVPVRLPAACARASKTCRAGSLVLVGEGLDLRRGCCTWCECRTRSRYRTRVCRTCSRCRVLNTCIRRYRRFGTDHSNRSTDYGPTAVLQFCSEICSLHCNLSAVLNFFSLEF